MITNLLKVLPLALLLFTAPAFAEDAHHHDEAAEKPHFAIEKPATADAAWAMLDEASAAARKALEAKDAHALHETGEKLEVAISALKEHPDAVEEAKREKLTSALDQLGKAIDRLHHAAEDNDTAGATEALDLIDSLRPLTKSLYPSKVAP